MKAHACRLLLTLSALLSACESDQMPDDTVLTITPAERTIEITEYRGADGRCLIGDAYYVDLPILLALQSGDGSPVGDARVRVYVDLAGNTFSGYPVLGLYRDWNGNGVVDGNEELVSSADDAIASVTTDEYDGHASLLLRVNLSCAYRGEVFAYAGAASAIASIKVEAADVVVVEDNEQ